QHVKFGGWQLKNGKITGKKWKIGQKSVKKRSKIGQKSVKEWSNGLCFSIHGCSLLLQASPKKIIGV
ncbi:MAG: hypothetical protein GY696_24215, partial [Gammaproteobacteria bacterium]|nr:hypothetical protein [Gammaproteobacteria bacterium]